MLLVLGLSRPCALSNHLFHTIGFIGTVKKMLSGVLVVELWHPSTKHHLYAVFLTFYRIFNRRQYKDATQSDCTQRRDVTVSSETFDCFRHIFGKFKILTFLMLIKKLLLTKKFRKKFCGQMWPPNFIFWSL